MSDALIKAAIELAKAIETERFMMRMMCDCPKDDIDLALDKFNEELKKRE